MDLLTAIQSEPLSKIQEIVLQKGLPIDSIWLDYDALNRALAYKRKDVAKWLIKQHSCRVNKISDSNSRMLGNTPLHNAVKLGDTEIVEMLLKNKASIVAGDSDDNTALHISFLYRYNKITDLLLGHIVENPNYTNEKNNQGLSHMHIACSRNNVKAVEGFLKAEANIGDTVKADSPSSWAGYTALHFAIESRSLEAAKIILAAGSKLKDDENNTEQSPLQLLQHYRDEYLIMSDHLDKSAFPYFHLACCKENASVVKKFINKGADVNKTIEWGISLCNHYSPLQFAIESSYDRKEKVQLLLSHGATVEQAECHGKHNCMTALHMAFYNEYHMSDLDSTIVDCLYKAVKNREENFVDQNELSYFHIVVTRNDFVAVKTHLDNGANINQAVLQNDRGFSGYSALLFAVQYQLVDMAKFLIDRGANVSAGDSGKHQTPLFKAFQMGKINLIKLLLKSGARLEETADASGNTLLHYAAEAGSQEIVQYLIDSGNYDVNCQNNLGQTPLIVSLDEVDAPCQEVVEILLNKGADIFMKDNNDDYAMAIVNSSGWLIADMERLRIFTMFLEEESDLMHFDVLEEVDERVIEMLLRTGVDLSAPYDNGDTLVHLLAKNPNPGVIEQLRGHDFEVDARDNQGWTPLMLAVINGIANAVEFLLDEGADIEAADKVRRLTPLYLAMNSTIFIEEYRECVQILLERGANAQVEIADDAGPTILDIVSRNQYFELGELVLAHLAFQEANGTAITQLIRDKIDSRDRFKSYYEYCQQEMSVVIYNSVTLFDVLTASERKLERYLRKKVMASKLTAYQTADYFKTILDKRLPSPIAMIELRKAAEPVVCELTMIDYDSFPCFADEIVGYLEKQDLENLISM